MSAGVRSPLSINGDDESRGAPASRLVASGTHLRRVTGDRQSLAGGESGGRDHGDGSLGGEGGRGVDEGGAVAERRAHQPGLAADQTLVHLEGHGSGGVGEAQRRAGRRRRRRKRRRKRQDIVVQNHS